MKSALLLASLILASNIHDAHAAPRACFVSEANVGMDPGAFQGCMVVNCGAYQVMVDGQLQALYKYGSFDYVGGDANVKPETARQAALATARRLRMAGVCKVIVEN